MTTRIRRTRWLSIPELADQIIKRTNALAREIASKPRKRQLEAVRRLVTRAERRDEERITKRVGREIYVKLYALEALLPADAESVGQLEVAVADVAQITRQIRKQQNGHGASIRLHAHRLTILEQKQQVNERYQREMAEIDSRAAAAS